MFFRKKSENYINTKKNIKKITSFYSTKFASMRENTDDFDNICVNQV